jgi:hypothetical protein
MIDTVEYELQNFDGRTGTYKPVTRRGVQVGRFAVRQTEPNEYSFDVNDPDPIEVPVRRFVIEHVPSGFRCGHFDEFADALVYVDDLSRFSESDPDATSSDAVLAQLGPLLVKWAIACHAHNRAVPFREWRMRHVTGATKE